MKKQADASSGLRSRLRPQPRALMGAEPSGTAGTIAQRDLPVPRPAFEGLRNGGDMKKQPDASSGLRSRLRLQPRALMGAEPRTADAVRPAFEGLRNEGQQKKPAEVDTPRQLQFLPCTGIRRLFQPRETTSAAPGQDCRIAFAKKTLCNSFVADR